MGDISMPDPTSSPILEVEGERSKPGILIIHIKLKPPFFENSALFKKWTRLHFIDMLKLQDTTTTPTSMTSSACRFVPEKLDSLYIHTVHANSASIFNTQAFHDISRRLDLENTRDLAYDEEPVGKEGMVWDICSSVEFGVFEEVKIEGPESGIGSVNGSFQDLPVDVITKQHGPTIFVRGEVEFGRTHLITVHLTSTIVAGMKEHVPVELKDLLYEIGQGFSASNNECNGNTDVRCFDVYSTLYRYGGKRAQPDGYPLVIKDEEDEEDKWVIMITVVGWDMKGVRLKIKNKEGEMMAREMGYDVKDTKDTKQSTMEVTGDEARIEVSDRAATAIEKWTKQHDVHGNKVQITNWEVLGGELFMA